MLPLTILEQFLLPGDMACWAGDTSLVQWTGQCQAAFTHLLYSTIEKEFLVIQRAVFLCYYLLGCLFSAQTTPRSSGSTA